MSKSLRFEVPSLTASRWGFRGSFSVSSAGRAIPAILRDQTRPFSSSYTRAKDSQVGIDTRNPYARVSDEIRAAVRSQKPVVGLETSIYTHGKPYMST